MRKLVPAAAFLIPIWLAGSAEIAVPKSRGECTEFSSTPSPRSVAQPGASPSAGILPCFEQVEKCSGGPISCPCGCELIEVRDPFVVNVGQPDAAVVGRFFVRGFQMGPNGCSTGICGQYEVCPVLQDASQPEESDLLNSIYGWIRQLFDSGEPATQGGFWNSPPSALGGVRAGLDALPDSAFVMQPASPAIAWGELVVPPESATMLLGFQFTQVQDLDFLQVTLGTDIAYSFVADASVLDQMQIVGIDVQGFQDSTVPIHVVLSGENGEPGSIALFADAVVFTEATLEDFDTFVSDLLFYDHFES